LSLTIATAGHVDHGKSTLVEALTGSHPDRLAAEAARGLTIDLGFGAAQLPSGRTLSIVDVPGHERFIRNMLAGVGAIDACLFVVAANEGWMPQSEEHLRILELLGVSQGVIALTKVAVCEPDIAHLAHLEVTEKAAGTFLADAPVVPTDVPTGIGLQELRSELDHLLDRTPVAANNQRPRLWVDRSFAAKGAGTVVTGTLGGGHLHIGEELLLHPNNHMVRVRALQTHHQEYASIAPGNRVAVNLTGIGYQQINRGHVLVKPAQWHLTNCFDASVAILSTLNHQVSRRGAHTIYIGTSELPTKMRILGQQTIEPADTGLVRLYLQRKLPLLPGDRFVLRESGRAETIGGGTVLDVAPVLAASKANPDGSIHRLIAERGWVEAKELALLTGQNHQPTVGRWLVSPSLLEQTKIKLRQAVADAGSVGLDIATCSDKERAVLGLLAEVVISNGRARNSAQPDPFQDHPYIVALQSVLFAPPSPVDVGVEVLEARELTKRGLAIEQNGIFFAAEAVVEAQGVLTEMLHNKPEGITVAEIRQRLGTSRKYALALLAYLDANGITRRREDVRIAGPRLTGPV